MSAMVEQKAVAVRAACLLGITLALTFWLGLLIGQHTAPAHKPDLCHTKADHGCVWVDGTASWQP